MVNSALKSKIFKTKVRISLIFYTGSSRCCTSYKIDFLELAENPGADKLKGIVTGLKIKGKCFSGTTWKGHNSKNKGILCARSIRGYKNHAYSVHKYH